MAINFLGARTGRVWVLAVLLVAGATLVGSAHSSQALTSLAVLTAPQTALPEGCALERLPASTTPPAGSDAVIDPVTGAGFPSNPWTGTDGILAAVIRTAIDGVMPGRTADQVREAYRASYVSKEGARTEVYAITFADAKLVHQEPPPGSNRDKTLSARLARSATIIKVVSEITPPNWCFDPLQLHIATQK